MDEALAELGREYEAVTGLPLRCPELDIFDLDLDSISVLELISRLRHRGYPVRVDDVVSAESMTEVARVMARIRS